MPRPFTDPSGSLPSSICVTGLVAGMFHATQCSTSSGLPPMATSRSWKMMANVCAVSGTLLSLKSGCVLLP